MKSIQRYDAIQRKLGVVALDANLYGAFLVMFNFSFIDPNTRGLFTNWEKNLSFRAVVILILLILGVALSSQLDKPLGVWYEPVASGQASAPAPLDVRQLALNLPAMSAGTSLPMWVMTGLIFSFAYNPATGEIHWASFFQVLLGTAVIAGVTTVLHYFATERSWQNELALFFWRKRTGSHVGILSECSQSAAGLVHSKQRAIVVNGVALVQLSGANSHINPAA